ncbi:hypothetical protein LTR70_004812 [Exophiala xenobiotica]|uniref:Uncharacterized protein n=1 Tax=Lithohypha guttulata TaxID=1690604 RepID=A0ABR0KCG3_9EURO|nr:hypothetical protein LTR24_004304 [Lithohypha guttulata]KAK5319902.1 hypothetical protein LTR70_004812 [Exophiala xenobiotica]
MALNIKHWHPANLAKRKKAPTICDKRWEKFKADIIWFHRFDLPHTEILSVLKKKHDFEPTSEMDLDRVRMRRPGGAIRDEIWLRMMRLLDRSHALVGHLVAPKTRLASGGGPKVSEIISDDLEYSEPKLRRAAILDCKDCKEQVASRNGETLHLMQAWLSSFERMDPASLLATMVLVAYLFHTSLALALLHGLEDKQSGQHVKDRRIYLHAAGGLTHLDAAGMLTSIGFGMQNNGGYLTE